MKTLSSLLFTLCFTFLSLLSAHAASDNFIFISSEGEVILNGKSLGYGSNLITDEDSYAFEQMKDDGVHLIFNGKDVGLGQHPQITQGKLLYETEKDLINTIVFDGQNYGEGYDSIAKDGHFLYFQKVRNENLRKADQGLILAFYDGKYYCDGKDDSIKNKIFMVGNQVICEQEIIKKDGTKTFIVLNGKVTAEGKLPNISKTHYEFSQEQDIDGTKITVISFDGKNLGEGSDFRFSDESFFYLKKNLAGKDEIIFNGKNLGTFKSLDTVFFQDGHIVFYRDITERVRNTTGVYADALIPQLFFDGIDYGSADTPTPTAAGKKIYLSGGHVAFERTLKGTKYDKDGKMQSLDVTYLVFNGRERTQIQPGTLQMDNGTFAFSKKKSVYDPKLASGQKTSDGKDILGKWVEKDFIYKGTANGSFIELGEGDPSTITVADGRVAYIKMDTEDRGITTDGVTTTVKVAVTAMMIDGTKKGVGDIATLIMDKGQYAFAENKMGRFMLTINAKQQAFPGLQVKFLGSTQSSQNSTDSITANAPQIIDGKLLKRAGKYFVLANKDKKYYYIIPSKTQQIDAFANKFISVKIEKKIYEYEVSKRKFYAYKLIAFSEKSLVEADLTSSYKGLLTRTGTTYTLKVGTKDYKLKLLSSLKITDLEPYIDTVMTFKLKQNGNEWEVGKLPE